MAGTEIEARKLTGMQEQFAWLVVADATINGNPEAAAIKAGYSRTSADQQGRKLMLNPDVQRQIRTNQRKSLAELATASIHCAKTLLSDNATPASAKVTLIKAIWGAAGIQEPQALDNDGDKPLTERDKTELKAFVRDGLSKMAETASEVRASQAIDNTVGG